MTRVPILALVMPVVTAMCCFGQVENCTSYRKGIDRLMATDRSRDPTSYEAALRGLLDLGQHERCFVVYAAGVLSPDPAGKGVIEREFEGVARRIEASRTDKQAGPGAGGTASTSVVSQGPVAKGLSVATEYGALTRSVNGQAITIRGNLAGVPSALARNNILPYCLATERRNGYCVSKSVLNILRRVSFGVSFDASRDGQSITGTPATGTSGSGATAQPVTFTGKKREISLVSARIEFWNHRDVTSKAFLDKWKAQVGTWMNEATGALVKVQIYGPVSALPEYEEWQKRAQRRIEAAGRDRAAVEKALNESLRDLLDTVKRKIPDLGERVDQATAAYNRFFIDQNELVESLAKQPVLAFECTNNRPLGQEPASTFRLIFDLPLTVQTRLVANGAIEIYDSVPKEAAAAVKRFRDAQFAFELDHGLGSASILGPATVSLAGYYQRQNTAALLQVNPANPVSGITFTGLPPGAKTVFTKTGNIWLAQAKLSLAPQGSSVKIPLSVTYSNRTELIDKPTWRAQVGVSYDFDSLFSGLAKQ
jgi:hypothetical protein